MEREKETWKRKKKKVKTLFINLFVRVGDIMREGGARKADPYGLP